MWRWPLSAQKHLLPAHLLSPRIPAANSSHPIAARRPLFQEIFIKIKALVPILFGSLVVNDGELFETLELHGRELIKKGYAVQVDDDNPVELPELP